MALPTDQKVEGSSPSERANLPQGSSFSRLAIILSVIGLDPGVNEFCDERPLAHGSPISDLQPWFWPGLVKRDGSPIGRLALPNTY